ncbi:LysE/ArgO family amino acid transporter [Vibrio rumoiensis]|uniref:LysE/ArgO family amino acid transporter n=1 Tax=Vibrio rumoiensis TaxID=76258 RepID=UPI003AA88C47
MYLSSVITGFTTGAGLIICIGSQNAFVLRQGLLRSHLFIIASVCILSDIALIYCGITGLGLIFDEQPVFVELLRYAGAVFLGANAIFAAKRAWVGGEGLIPSTSAVLSRNQVLLTCLGYTLLNPHVYIDTVFMLGSLSMQYSGTGKWEFGIGAMLASITWFLSISYGARFLIPLFRSSIAWRILDSVVAVMMGYLGMSLLLFPLN